MTSWKVTLDGTTVQGRAGEVLLDRMLEAGVEAPHGCRAGACLSCRVRVTDGTAAPSWGQGLPPADREAGWVLACRAKPTADLALSYESSRLRHEVICLKHELVGADVARIQLSIPDGMSFRAGQNLLVGDQALGAERPYSIASRPADGQLELHVRRVDGGQVSSWLVERLAAGERVSISAPSGDVCLREDDRDRPLLLAGIGTGLAPLLGVLRDALDTPSEAPLDLVFAGRTEQRLYLLDELRRLRDLGEGRVRLHLLVQSGQGLHDDVVEADAHAYLEERWPDLEGTGVFLAGAPAFVDRARRIAFLAGAAMGDIRADAFVASDAVN